MKRIGLLMALFFTTLISSTAFATENETVNRAAQAAFQRRFPNANLEKWQQLPQSEIYQVTFIYNHERLVSFIGTDGTIHGFARNSMNDQLPFPVSEAFQKKYGNYLLTSAEEFITDYDVSYLFSVEDAERKLYIRISTTGNITVLKKTKK